MPVSENTLQCIIAARDEFTAVFEKIMGRAMTTMQKGQKQTDFFSGGLVRMFAKFSIIEHGLRRLGTYIGGALYPFKAVEEINMSLIRMSAMFTGMMEAPTGGKTIANQFQQSFAYSQQLFQTLVKINPTIAGGLSDLMLITEEMAKQGIVMDVNNAKQVQGFTNLANAVIIVSAGYQNREVQIRQEARSLMEGVIRPTNQLAMIVNSMVGGNLKVMTDQWKRQGTYLEEMGKLLKGFEAAGGRIALTWDAVWTTFKSIIQLNMYENFQGMYLDAMRKMSEFNDWLMKNKDIVGGYLKAAWDSLANPVKAVIDAFGTLLSTLDKIFAYFDAGSAKSIPKVILFTLGTIIPEVLKGTVSWIEIINKELDKVIEKQDKFGKSKSGARQVIESVVGPLAGFGQKVFETTFRLDTNKLKSDWKNLGIQLGDARVDGEESRYIQRWKEFGESQATALKLKPQPADPEAVKKYNEFLTSIEDTTTKKGDAIWGSFWVKWKHGFELAEKAGVTDLIPLLEAMAALKEEYYKKDLIHKSETNIKILKVDKDNWMNQLAVIQERANIMRNQGESEVDIKRYVSEKEKEIFEEYDKYVGKVVDQGVAKRDADVKKEINQSNRLREAKHDSYVKWMEDLKMVDEVKDEGFAKEGEIYDYLLTKTGKYYDYTLSRSMQALDIEGEAFAAKFEGIIDIQTVMLYYYKKMEDKELELAEIRLKHQDDFWKGWDVAYKKSLKEQMTWGQKGLEMYANTQKAMEQTFSDFFYDAWTGKLKNAEEYFRSFCQSILRAWADAVSQMAAKEAMLGLTKLGASLWGTSGPATEYGAGPNAGYEMATVSHAGGYPVPRLHRGLASDEFPAILQTGERVLSRSETTSLDSTRGRGQEVNITINAVDSSSFVNLLYSNRHALDALVASSIDTNGPTGKRIRR